MKLPVLKAFSASFAYFAMRFRDVLRASWLGVLLLTVAMIVLMPRYLEPMMQMQMVDPNDDPAAALSVMGPALQWLALMYLAMAIVYPMLIVGNLRPLLCGEKLRPPYYLNFGIDELRILGAFLLWLAMTLIIAIVGFTVLTAVSVALTAISPAIGGALSLMGTAAFLTAIIWFSLRMSLIYPATLIEGEIGLPHSWRATKGNSSRLFLYWLLWVGVFVAIGLIYSSIVLPGYYDAIIELFAAGQDQIEQQAATAKINQMQLDMWDISKPRGMLNVALSYIHTLVTVALWNIAAGTAYRYLTEGGARA